MPYKGTKTVNAVLLQDAIYEKIVSHISRFGYPPTLRWLRDELNISSTSNVAYHLKALEEQGRIIRDKGVSRGIRTVDNVVY